MAYVLITNESTKLYVEVDKVETTDLSYNITLLNNDNSKTIFKQLKGATFHVFTNANDNTIIALPLEGWECIEIPEEEYKQSISNSLDNTAKALMNIISKSQLQTTYILISYVYTNGIIQNDSLLFKIKKGMSNNNYIIANITVIDNNTQYYMHQGLKATKIMQKFNQYEDLCLFLSKIANQTCSDMKKIDSIDEVCSDLFEF